MNVTDPFYIPQKITPKLNSKNIWGLGTIIDTDVRPISGDCFEFNLIQHMCVTSTGQIPRRTER